MITSRNCRLPVLALAAISLIGCSSGKGNSKTVVGNSGLSPTAQSATTHTAQSTDPDLRAPFKAFAVGVGTAAGADLDLLNLWLTAEQPHLTSPLPVVPVDEAGAMRVVSTQVNESMGWHVEQVSAGRWRVGSKVEGQSLSAAVSSMGIEPDADRPASALNHYDTLPREAQILNGIAWALTLLPNPSLAGVDCLKDQLGLTVPPQTISVIEGALGPVQVFTSTEGRIRFDFNTGNTHYLLVAEQKLFVRMTPEEAGLPPNPSRPGARSVMVKAEPGTPNAKVARQTMLYSEDMIDGPTNSANKEYGFDQPNRWIEVPGGLASL